ncbi:MAG: hypothetical protein V1750_04070 [Acidobacteriota bacterium]
MRPLSLISLLVLAAHAPARAQITVLRFDRVDSETAARFVATVFRFPVLAQAGDAAPARWELRAKDGASALRAVAQTYRLEVMSLGALRILAPAGLAAREPPPLWPQPSRRVDLDFPRAEVQNIVRLLASIEKQKVEGDLPGNAVAILARNIEAKQLLQALAWICRLDISRRRVVLAGSDRCPAGQPILALARPGSIPDLGQRRVFLADVPVRKLRLAATAVGRVSLALLAETGVTAPPPRTNIVRRGDWVGKVTKPCGESPPLERASMDDLRDVERLETEQREYLALLKALSEGKLKGTERAVRVAELRQQQAALQDRLKRLKQRQTARQASTKRREASLPPECRPWVEGELAWRVDRIDADSLTLEPLLGQVGPTTRHGFRPLVIKMTSGTKAR